MACVDLSAFPLQLLLRREPAWRQRPAAVVESDKPQARLLHVNEPARRRRVLPGMRFAAALSLAGDLCAGVVPAKEIEEARLDLVRRLQGFTPGVEPARDDPGLFWLDASGLGMLYDSLDRWARLIREDLTEAGFDAAIAVGFRRFFIAAVAKHKAAGAAGAGARAAGAGATGIAVFQERGSEQAAARAVPLDRLALDPRVRDTLAKLGVHTLGAFADLPAEGIERRFGKEAAQLHRLARGEAEEPFDPVRLEEPPARRLILDFAEKDLARLMFLIARLLHPVLAELAGRGQALRAARIEFLLDGPGTAGGWHAERIRPAAPTLDAPQLLDLIYLRLQSIPLKGGVMEVKLAAGGARATRDQLELFAEVARRDLEAAGRALARIRAEFGDAAVMRARLREGHLPEARFAFEALDELPKAAPRKVASGSLVRRIFHKPAALPARPRHEPDGWMLRGLEQGPVVRVLGPYIVSGGWWRRAVHREYHFAETKNGELLWVYYDKVRRRWFIQGRVE